MKRLVAILVTLLPLSLLALFTFVPGLDRSVSLPIFHFYIVTFTTFSAAVISILLAASLGPEARPRHVLAAAAFAVIGSLFFSHGLATPNALIDHLHPAVSWSAWLTLLGGGFVFACAALDGPNGLPRWLPMRAIVYGAAGAVLLYSAVAAFRPDALDAIESQVDPWHQWTIFVITLLLWGFASARFWLLWRNSGNRVDGVLAFVALWMATAAVSMHRYTLWNLSWWLYHATLLVGFLITVAVLVQQYEQLRRFRLQRYYLGLSLIITALLALVASALFTQFSYNTLLSEMQASSVSLGGNIANSLARDLPEIVTADDLRRMANRSGLRGVVAQRLSGLPIESLTVYDDAGVAAYASEPEWIGVNVEDRSAFGTALRGETVAVVRPPDDPPATYHPSDEVHIIETYAPIRPGGSAEAAPIGVLVTVEEAPQLGAATLNARLTGLLTAVITMGLLFLALLTVVSRADSIITARTDELATAYTNLRAAEAMRDDLTNMIVHDLRNPLTAISASLDFVTKLDSDKQRATHDRMVRNAQTATGRMTSLIEDLLTVSKIEAGELQLQKQHVELADVLEEAVSTFSAQADVERKQLTTHCPPGLTLALDPPLIRRVVENLIGNALKYTDPDGKIEVLARADGDRVTVTVRDNGDGVPDEYKRSIFQKFVQFKGDGARPVRKGVGLGLAFCNLVVQKHGGEIHVEDAPGGGSDFVFWLPKS